MSKTTIGGESIRQGTPGHQSRSRSILAVVCAAIVMCATSVRAEPPENGGPKVTKTVTDEQNAPFSDNDPCIGGALVSGSGHLHTVFIDRSKPPNVDTTYRFQHNGEAKNVDVPSDPADYRFKSSGDTDLKSSTKNFSFTMKTREHIIRERGHYPEQPKDDYFVSTSFKMSGLDPKPVVIRESSESTCK